MGGSEMPANIPGGTTDPVMDSITAVLISTKRIIREPGSICTDRTLLL